MRDLNAVCDIANRGSKEEDCSAPLAEEDGRMISYRGQVGAAKVSAGWSNDEFLFENTRSLDDMVVMMCMHAYQPVRNTYFGAMQCIIMYRKPLCWRHAIGNT